MSSVVFSPVPDTPVMLHLIWEIPLPEDDEAHVGAYAHAALPILLQKYEEAAGIIFAVSHIQVDVDLTKQLPVKLTVVGSLAEQKWLKETRVES